MEYRFYRVLIFNEFSRSYKKDKTIGNFIIGWFVSPHHLSKHTDKLLLHFPTSYLILPTLLKLGSRNFYLDLEISEKASLYFPSHGFSSTFFFFFSSLFSFCFLVPTRAGKRRYTNSFRLCFPPGFLARLSVKRLRARNGKHIFVMHARTACSAGRKFCPRVGDVCACTRSQT